MSEFTEILKNNTNWEQFEIVEKNPYQRNLDFGEELEEIAEGIRGRFEDVTVTTSIYGFCKIKVRSKRDLSEFMGKLNELGRFTVLTKDLGSVFIYNINVKMNKYY